MKINSKRKLPEEDGLKWFISKNHRLVLTIVILLFHFIQIFAGF